MATQAYKVFWAKDNVPDEDWKRSKYTPPKISNLEVLLLADDLYQVYSAFSSGFPDLPISGITAVEKMSTPIVVQAK